MPDLYQLAAEARALGQDVEQLNETVAANNAQIEALNRRADRAETLITRTWVFLTGLVLLAGVIGVLLFQQLVTGDRLDQVVVAEKLARQEGQCPLLALFIGSYAPNSRAAGEDRQKYEDAFARIRAIYAKLGCTEPVVPGRSDQTTPPNR
jgi:hypothetical protein